MMYHVPELPDLSARPSGPRTYRPRRQRVRPRIDGDIKAQPVRRAGGSVMEGENEQSFGDGLIDRDTLCLPDFAKGTIVHGGDQRFNQVARQYFTTPESNATERLVNLKTRLRNASTHDFWGMLLEEICEITGSQCAFVAKPMLIDDQDSAVEMPELGEPGSCLMGVALYVNNGSGVRQLYRDHRYHAYGTPFAYMTHDKVFIVPERMSEFTFSNLNEMPWEQSEAFIGLPLFSEGKNFAHFGLIWSADGAPKRQLEWSFIEMMLHALEDMVLQRIVEGLVEQDPTPAKVIPSSALTGSQILKPYARSLSHELRTPMQGVIGMLDIMYSTILNAISTQSSDRVRDVFTVLKSHIETVQESSRRAVEAADNVVHAYDLNMQMPETPLTPDSSVQASLSVAPSVTHSPTAEPAKLPTPSVHKRASPDEEDCHTGRPRKRMFTISEAEILRKYYPEDAISSCGVCGMVTAEPTMLNLLDCDPSASKEPLIISATLSSGHHKVETRVFMRDVLNEALRNGHTTSKVHANSDLGETIEFKSTGPRGEVKERTVSLSIDTNIPEVIIIEESHLQFALQKVLDNAIKFTDNGDIAIAVKIARNSQIVEISVKDTGCGIAEEAQSRLFTPHFQEDASISRSRDGLGLSLFNAKACVRKNLGGDITLERSATHGPSKGSEFLISLPISIFNMVNMEAPLVRTPPSGTTADGKDVPDLPAPGLGFNIPTNELALVPSGTMIPSGPPSRPIAKSKSSYKRASPIFNSNLATRHPLNILLAEDNEMNRKVGVGALKRLGYSDENITLAFDGLEAVEQYTASISNPGRRKFDLILMDIWMPRMDGYEATNQILNIAQQNGISAKVIAVTADITEDCRQKAVAIGMQGLLAKPYKVLDMEHLIMEHFSEC